jgi:hypothetical protein
VPNFSKQIIDLSSSCKIIPFKKNYLTQSSESEDVVDLNLRIFKVFFCDDYGTVKLINFDRMLKLLPH